MITTKDNADEAVTWNTALSLIGLACGASISLSHEDSMLFVAHHRGFVFTT
jgi:hypothetical protein